MAPALPVGNFGTFPFRGQLSGKPLLELPGPFLPVRINVSRRAAANSPKRDRSLVTAFPSPEKAFACANSVTGSMVLACYFAHLLTGFSCPFGFLAPPPAAGSPQLPAASTPQARCILARPALPAVLPVSAPLQEFSLPPDRSINWLRNRSVRLPESPDLRSLPAAFPFKDSAADQRSRSATLP